jgi:hypothetical protein
MKLTPIILLSLTALFSADSLAAQVECLISGTPTRQEFRADFCSSRVNSTPGVVFRLKADRPVAEVTWSYNALNYGRWNCSGSTSCTYTQSTRLGTTEVEGEASACVTRILYSDNTWENTNICANAFYYGNSISPFTVGDESLNE